MRLLLLLLLPAAVGALLAGGCGSTEDEPPVAPTAEQLAALPAQTRAPAYWLGPSYQDLPVSFAGSVRFPRDRYRRMQITYGQWSCSSGSGCSDPGGVTTGRRNMDLSGYVEPRAEADPAECWRRVGDTVAVVLWCVPDGYPQEIEILSGDLSIDVTSLVAADGWDEISVDRVLRALRPVNAAAPWPLPPPDRLSCRELRRVPADYRRHMPGVLRPRQPC